MAKTLYFAMICLILLGCVDLPRSGVQTERHPPDGRISSSEEQMDLKFDQLKSQRKAREHPDLSKEDSKNNLFKLINKPSAININRGRGFARENAFIKKF